MRRVKHKELWLTNISRDRDVSLRDLHLTVRRGRSVNVLDPKHYHYTEEQVKESIEKGSVYKKRHLIKVREVAPLKFNTIKRVADTHVSRDLRSSVQIQEKTYEDLDFLDDMTDEQAAMEESDLSYFDQKPRLAVDRKYKFDDIDEEEQN